ncbi:hypothetical protein [Saccharopolyspora taberi]|uniref:Uncharacterized protein n=1 Tax=Saccharopolyspora taberi TaxID=60895 RepID=A0ABN3V0Q6_9PSEU
MDENEITTLLNDESTLQDMLSWLEDEVCSDVLMINPRSASDRDIVEAIEEHYPGGAAGFQRHH